MTATATATPSSPLPLARVAARKPAGAAVGIPPRQIDFRFPRDSKRYFFDDNGFSTLFFATLSGFFPPGERFFMDSVRHYRDEISGERLKACISGFMGQEAVHGREHERLNELLSSRGIKVGMAERSVKRALGVLRRFSPAQQLACTIFMEHFTALFAEELLSNQRFRDKVDPQLLHLWVWHALEELEHKAVAYDVYEQVSGSYAHRVMAVPLTAVALVPAIVASMVYLLNADRELFNGAENRRGFRLLFAKRGFIARFMPRMGEFLRRDFHPDDHNTDALVKQWQEKLFGENGSLLEEFRNREALMN
ncbi:MAG: metal-dependent hydrolase [bacterium]|nr:metal-dependent hydrolase [bacterium]